LEETKRKIILDKEKEWRMKRQAIWLQAGDKSRKFFHHFANNRKTVNTIWGIDRMDRTRANSFSELFEGVHHFNSLYKVETKASIDVILKVTSYFPRFIESDEKRTLMAKITKEELLVFYRGSRKKEAKAQMVEYSWTTG
jgi:hypothetical protein